MDARLNADDFACQIIKSHDDDVKNKHSTEGATKFGVQFSKGTEEEFPEESTLALETVSSIKEEYSMQI